MTKNSTSKSLAWSTLDKFGVQVFALIVGVFTARMLVPKDFGIIACLAVFTALSNVLVDSGLSAALIRRNNNNNNNEYSAIFIFNIALSIVLYLLLWVNANNLAKYFDIPQIDKLARFVFLAIIINSLGIIQNVIFSKEMKFKQISIANLIAAIVSAIVTVVLILKNYTYWAIAWQQISMVTIRVIVLWLLSDWRPFHAPDFSVIKKLFSFSFFLLSSNIINVVVKYIYNLKIPIYFSVYDLGNYDRAKKFQEIPSTVVSAAVTSVAYPILSSLNTKPEQQLQFFRKINRVIAFLIFPTMLTLVGTIDNIITIVLTDKWLGAAPYFKIFCAAGIFFSFQQIALIAFNAIGKPKHYLYLELFRNFLTVVLFVFFSKTIEQMLWGYTAAMFISYVVDIIAIGKLLKYSILEHIKDILPYFILSVATLLIILLVAKLNLNIYILLTMQFLAGGLLYTISAYLLGSKVIKDCRELIFGTIKTKNKNNRVNSP